MGELLRPHEKENTNKTGDYPPMHTIHNLRDKDRAIAGKVGCRDQFQGESILLIDVTNCNMVTKRKCAQVLQDHGAGEIWSRIIGEW